MIEEVIETKTRRLLTFEHWGQSHQMHGNKQNWIFNMSVSVLQELDIIPDLMGENTRYLLKEWNFIQVSVSSHFSYNPSEKWKHVHVNIHDLFGQRSM